MVDEDGSLVNIGVVEIDAWELLCFKDGVELGSADENTSSVKLRVDEK